MSCGLIAWIGLAGVGQAAELLPINSSTFPASPIYMPPSSAAPWTGWNLGAQLGLGWIRNSAPATFGGLDATSFSEGGFARLKGGLFGGYDWLIGRYVVGGLEGDFSYGGVKAQLTNAPASVGANGELLELWDASARVRLGVLPVSKVLLYATAGGAYSQYNESVTDGEKMTMRKEKAPSGLMMVDGISIGDTQDVVIRDRVMLAKDGMFVIIALIDQKTGKLKKSPDLISRGFVYLKENQDFCVR